MNAVEFGSLFHFIRNGMNVKQDKSGDGIPITRIETIADAAVDTTRVGFAGLKEENCRDWLMKPGDILFSHINSVEHIGKCAVYRGNPEKLVHGMNLLCLRCDEEKLFPEFAKYLIRENSFRSRLSNYINKAVNQASVSIGNLKSIPVSVPSLPEQRRIAAILDQVDALRSKRREALAQLDNLTQSVFIEMFGDYQSVFTRWPVKKLGDLLDFLTSGSRGWAEYYADTGALFLRIQNVLRDELSLDDVAYVNAPDSVEAKRTEVREGDVLLSITADLGRTAVIPHGIGKAHINQHLSILRTQAVVPKFLSAFMSSEAGQLEILSRNKQGVKAGLNFDDIRSFRIPLPPHQLQLEFAQRAQRVVDQKALQHKSLVELDRLFASLQHRAFRGEL